MNQTRKLVFEAVFITLGFCLPQFFHLIAGPAAGSLFLPMHIPVILSGLILGAGYGFFTGFSLPVLSMLIMSMPSVARMPFMVVELSVYGAAAGFCKKLPMYLSLSIILIAGRAAYFLSLVLAFYVLNLGVQPFAAFVTVIISGLGGVVIQFAVLPPLVIYLRRYNNVKAVGTIKQGG